MRQQVVNKGYGSWLLPPDHPDHAYSVEYWKPRQPEILTLAQAINDPRIEIAIRERCEEIVNEWKESSSVYDKAEWVSMVLGYWRNCYTSKTPHAEYNRNVCLWIDYESDPLEFAHAHTGVNWIRQFYPDYEPTRGDFDNAWYGEGITQ